MRNGYRQLHPHQMLVMLVLLLVFQTALAGNRVALVIGNSAYPESALSNPQHDADDIAKTLVEVGFDPDDVIVVKDASHDTMTKAVQAFRNKLGTNTEMAFFFYAGHGAQFANKNYLIPVSATIRVAEDLPLEAVDAGEILYQMSGRASQLNVMVLDACRDLPFRVMNRGSTRGLAQMETSGPMPMLVAYSTAPGNTASDGNGRNSPYTAELLKLLPQPDLPLSQLFNDVGMAVKNATSNRQEPWMSNSPLPRVYLGGRSQQQVVVPVPPVATHAQVSSTPTAPATHPQPLYTAPIRPFQPSRPPRRCAADDWKCQDKMEGVAPGY